LDAKSNIHGDLILLGFTYKISLCKLLVTTQHGDFFPELLKLDLQAKTEVKIGPKFTSIVAPGPTPGTRTLESDLNFSIMTDEELEQNYVTTPYPDQPEVPLLPEDDFQPFIPQAKMERTIRRNKKRNDWYKRKHVNPIEGPDAALQADGGMPEIDWDAYRTEDYVDSEDEEEDRERRLERQARREEYERRALPLPAGIDIGMFMEEALRRMPEPALGPRQIRRDLLTNPDPNLAENFHDNDQYFDPDLSQMSVSTL